MSWSTQAKGSIDHAAEHVRSAIIDAAKHDVGNTDLQRQAAAAGEAAAQLVRSFAAKHGEREISVSSSGHLDPNGESSFQLSVTPQEAPKAETASTTTDRSTAGEADAAESRRSRTT